MTAEARAYRLVIERGPSASRAWVERTGPAHPLSVAVGQKVEVVARLPGLLFPICPIAHTAAALGAVERAAGVTLAPGQAAARHALVEAERVAGAVWRAGLSWPALIGAAPNPEPVRQARAAATALETALFADDWRQIGGAAMAVDRAGAADAWRELELARAAVAANARAVIEAADRATSGALDPATPLGDRVFDPAVTPEAAAFEETPGAHTAPRTLADRLRAAAAIPVPALDRRGLVDAPPSAAPAAPSGVGLCVTQTARGRLRHCVCVEDGVITQWRAAAPTDWNFAPDGPVARHAASVAASPGDALEDRALENRARWLVAAFDPCAPCTVSVQEAAYA